jgi:hypothetical protein
MEISKFLIFFEFFYHFILIFAKLEGDPRGRGGVRCGWKFSGLSSAHYQCAPVVSALSPAHKALFAGGNFWIITPGAWALIRQW